MHRPIRRFEIEGQIGDDKDFIRLRQEYERLLVQDMRSQGVVPHLDLQPVFTISYNGVYDFKLSMYGQFVGKRKAQEVEGVSFGRLIYRSTDSGSVERVQNSS